MASIRALVRHVRLEIWKRIPATRSKVLSHLSTKREFGANGIDTELLNLFGKKNGYYVEIGANDGIAQSNTLQLELFHNWTGVLIEPVPVTFAKLQRNRSKRRNHLERTACVGFDYEKESVELIFSGLMTTPSRLESDISDAESHAARGRAFVKPAEKALAMQKILVPAMTMTEVLKRARAPKVIDFLSLDVEGAELEVIKGLDFSQYAIHWMLIESRDLARMSTFLEPLGYKLHSQLSGHDYLFELCSTP